MFDGLLENAGQYIQTNPWLGIVAVFVGGMLTASNPCVLAMIPLTMSFVAGGKPGEGGVLRAAGFSALFALGHSVLIIVAGTSMGAAKKLIESKRLTRATSVMRRVAGGVIVLVGVYFTYRGLS